MIFHGIDTAQLATCLDCELEFDFTELQAGVYIWGARHQATCPIHLGVTR